MIKKICCLTFLACLLIALVACRFIKADEKPTSAMPLESGSPTYSPSSEPRPSLSPNPPESFSPNENGFLDSMTKNSPEINAYKAIIQGSTPFINANNGGDVFLSQIARIIAPYESFDIVPDHYALVDLDGNESLEMILTLPITQESFYGYLVLRYEADVVYGYTFSQRQFSEIRKDGTFWTSGSASDVGICIIAFDGANYSIDKFTYSKSDLMGQIYYFVNHQESSEEEFHLAISTWQKKEYIEWISLSAEQPPR